MGRNNNGNPRDRIPEEVRDFAEMSLEQDKKAWKKDKKRHLTSMTEKDVEEGYYAALFDLSPYAITWVARYGHTQTPEAKEVTDGIYGKFVDNRLLKFARKMIKEEGIKAIPEYRIFPLVASTMLKSIDDANAVRKTEGKPLIDTTRLEELCKMCFKKKYKKLVDKMGISEEIAFPILMAYPHKSCVEFGKTYRIRVFFDTLYKLASMLDVSFDLIMNEVVDEDQWAAFVAFALLEKKTRCSNNEAQQKLFYSITKWCLNFLEDSSDDEIRTILQVYINARKKDAEAGKDAARRFPLSSLSKDEYPTIVSAMNGILAGNPANKDYLD